MALIHIVTNQQRESLRTIQPSYTKSAFRRVQIRSGNWTTHKVSLQADYEWAMGNRLKGGIVWVNNNTPFEWEVEVVIAKFKKIFSL